MNKDEEQSFYNTYTLKYQVRNYLVSYYDCSYQPTLKKGQKTAKKGGFFSVWNGIKQKVVSQSL